MCGTGIVIFLIFEQALYCMSFQSICTIKRNAKTGAELKLAGVETYKILTNNDVGQREG